MKLEFRVGGIPAPKGSMRGRKGGGSPVPGGSPVNAAAQKDFGKNVVDAAVAALAAAGYAGRIMFTRVPIRLTAVWYYKRPGGHFIDKGPNAGQLKPTAPRYPIVAPDTSKVLRAFEDWLNALVWRDDAEVVETLMRKEYATIPGREGCWIKIEQLEEKPR